MRHFSLMKILTVSSFATSPNRSQPNTLSQQQTSPDQDNKASETSGRRAAIYSILLAPVAFVAPKSTPALDMDAFVNSELASDTKNCDPKRDSKCKPELTKDEALCKYGQSGDARSDACKRVKAAGGAVPDKASQGKSLGGAYAM